MYIEHQALDQFRAAILHAQRLEAEVASGTAAKEALEQINAAIASSQDETEIRNLYRKLADAETEDRIASIRAKKLATDLAAAWQAANDLARRAINDVSVAVGEACDGAYESFREICVAMLAPESKLLANEQPAVAFQINSSLASLAAAGLSTGPANLHQSRLTEAARKDHYQTQRQFCEGALLVCDQVLADIPNLRQQAALIEKCRVAVFKIAG